jgi:amidohydrolase
MTMLLGAAALLADKKGRLKGTVKFVFQPAEENGKGAKRMIEEGVLQNPTVDVALALHVDPEVETGKIAVKEGAVTACSDEFQVKILGKGGHSSSPQTTIDPIVVGAQLIMGIQTIVSRKISSLDPAVVSVCQFLAGTTTNVIPSTAAMTGKIRCYSPSVQKTIFDQLEIITKGICSAAGADYELEIVKQAPVTLNDRKVFRDFVRCASDLIGKENIRIMDNPQTFSEDFSLIAEKVPSVLFFIGTKNADKECNYPLHNPKFKIDEDVLPLGAALFADYCLNRQE